MQKFVIINGLTVSFIEKETMKDAITYCQNYCNHSDEVIVREYTQINI